MEKEEFFVLQRTTRNGDVDEVARAATPAPPASSELPNIEEERRQLEEDRKKLVLEQKALEDERMQIEQDRRKLKKLVAFKQRVAVLLAGFWKDKIRQHEEPDSEANGKESKETSNDTVEEQNETMTVTTMRDLLHRILQREEELSETSFLLRAQRAKKTKTDGGKDGDYIAELDEDDSDDDSFKEEEEEEGVLVLDETASSSSSSSSSSSEDEKKTKKQKAKKRKKVSNGREKISANGEGVEAVGSLLDAASHQEKMEQLKAFKDQFGHCKVPWAWKENPQLGRWVGRMRSMQRNGELGAGTRSELEAMDFCWNPITENSTQWDEKLAQLKEFKVRFGHLKVPWGWKENPALGRWVGRIRQQRRDGRLLAEREKLLSNMGFVWGFGNVSIRNSKKRKRKGKEKEKKKDKKKDKKKEHKKDKKKKTKKYKKIKTEDVAAEQLVATQKKAEVPTTQASQEDEEEGSGFAELTFASEEAAKIRSQMQDTESPGDV